MTPKEKAIELTDKYSNVPLLDNYEAKLCALITVDEIIKSNPHSTPIIYSVPAHSTMEYWQEVKNEIKKL